MTLNSKSSKKVNNGVQLSLKELSLIIRSCRRNNVLSLKYNGLELNLAENKQVSTHTSFKNSPLLPTEVEQDRSDAKDQALLDELELMKINDPVGYERMIAEEMNG